MRVKIFLALCILAVMLATPATALAAPDSATTPDGFWYKVKPGDTLSSISRKFGPPVDAIAAVNGIVNINRIWAGTWLWIPSRTGPRRRRPAPPVAPRSR